jgi:hypothetical protein
MAWYEDWFGEEYLELYAHCDAGEADRHVDFVERHLAGGERSAAFVFMTCHKRETSLPKTFYSALTSTVRAPTLYSP